MNVSFGQHLIDRAVSILGSQQPYPQFSIPPDDIASQPVLINAHAWRVLRVPPNYAAVISNDAGVRLVYPAGDHRLNLTTPGAYVLRFVDIAQRSLDLPPIRTQSRDAWQLSLTLSLIWQVERPDQALAVRHLVQQLQRYGQAVVEDYIHNMDHDQLICAPGGEPVISSAEISQTLRNYLQRYRGRLGVRVLDVLVVNRQGDQRRTEAVQQAIVKKTQLQQELEVTQAHTDVETARLKQQLELQDRRQQVELLQARTERLRVEEQEQVRLVKAQLAAQEAELRRSVELQKVEMQQRAEVQRLQFEQNKTALQVQGQAFTQLAQALMQMQMIPGLQRGQEGEVREVLARMLEGLAYNLPRVGDLPNGDQAAAAQAPLTLQERLAQEVSDFLLLPGAACERLHEQENGEVQVAVRYKGMQFLIQYGLNYPEQPPAVMMVRFTTQRAPEVLPLEWAAGMRLRAIIIQAVEILARSQQDQASPSPGD